MVHRPSSSSKRIVGRPLVVAVRRPSPADRNRSQRRGKFETSPPPRRGRAPSSSVVVDVRRRSPPRSGVCLREQVGLHERHGGPRGLALAPTNRVDQGIVR
mmetsp:Transcript_17310/g.56268  ORF Transcript_17310/g.56268 Transcript_17310/m.56268 type:complete len:101 (-) Transcript_17310:339-641(-)